VAGNPWPADEEEREGAEYLIEGLRRLIAEGNAVAEPTNLVPPRMAVERCTTQAAALSASEREACATPAAREAIAEEAEYRAQEASGKFGEATAEAIVAEAEAAAAAAAADAADSATALKAGRPKAARKGK
jgi:hypothetical protein